MLEWFEFSRDDLSPVTTLIEGLPVDDGALVVAIEPVPAESPGLLAKLLRRQPDHSPAAVHVLKFRGHDEPDHYDIRCVFPKGTPFAERVKVPGWARVDEVQPRQALVSAPLTVSADEVATFAASALRALAPQADGPTWRTIEADTAHLSVPGPDIW